MNVTLEDAYREACTALGEALVRERLLTARLAALEAAARDVDDAATPVVAPSTGQRSAQ